MCAREASRRHRIDFASSRLKNKHFTLESLELQCQGHADWSGTDDAKVPDLVIEGNPFNHALPASR